MTSLQFSRRAVRARSVRHVESTWSLALAIASIGSLVYMLTLLA